MDYQQAMDFIHKTELFGSKLGLDKIRILCQRLGAPQKELSFIHIAGTNGKGSVAAMLSAILTAAGHRVGLYTSPFLVSFEERIQVSGKPIEKDDVARLTEKVKNACSAMVDAGDDHPTEFELVTALGFLYFKEQNCDFVVLETGLGGRLDATNVIDAPKAAVITSIDYDHTQYLGDTLSAIAKEKCGIIKKGHVTVTSAAQEQEALDVISAHAENLALCELPTDIKTELGRTEFSYRGVRYAVCLSGRHQAQNATLAIQTAKTLGISDADIKTGLLNTSWPGRFEVVENNPVVIVDGAHNPAAMRTMRQNVSDFLSGKKKVFVMGMLCDKDYRECAEIIAPLADAIIAVDVNSPRNLSCEELAEELSLYCDDVRPCHDLEKALRLAKELAKDGAVCVFGSLYLVGEYKALIK